ncbi:hypothetical protein F4810DRAFT_674766 [Camillea tinctor]|nr:hypothetical protein F4810DRAFT_674766 [Camillea tinctor]
MSVKVIGHESRNESSMAQCCCLLSFPHLTSFYILGLVWDARKGVLLAFLLVLVASLFFILPSPS